MRDSYTNAPLKCHPAITVLGAFTRLQACRKRQNQFKYSLLPIFDITSQN